MVKVEASVRMALLAFLLADVGVAQLAQRWWIGWDPARSERRYRIRSATHHHDLAPLTDTTAVWGTMTHHLATNSLGFKDATPRTVPPRSDRPRLLLIGDSFTEGVGFPFEDTFAGLIAAALAPRGIEVLNAAVMSYAPTVYYRRIRALLEDVGLRVDAVVVFLDLSDIPDEALFYGLDAADNVTMDFDRAPDWVHRWAPGAYEDRRHFGRRLQDALETDSVTLHLAATIVRRMRYHVEGIAGVRPRTGEPTARWTVDDALFASLGVPGLARASASMDRLLAVLQPRSIPLTVVVYPWPDQVAVHDEPSRQETYWKEWTAARGVGFVDLFPTFLDRGDPERTLRECYIADDVHFSAAGHRLAAEAFLRQFAAAQAKTPAPMASATSSSVIPASSR